MQHVKTKSRDRTSPIEPSLDNMEESEVSYHPVHPQIEYMFSHDSARHRQVYTGPTGQQFYGEHQLQQSLLSAQS